MSKVKVFRVSARKDLVKAIDDLQSEIQAWLNRNPGYRVAMSHQNVWRSADQNHVTILITVFLEQKDAIVKYLEVGEYEN